MTKDRSSRREPFIARRDEPTAPRADLPRQKKKAQTLKAQPVAAPKKLGFIVLCFLVALLSLSLAALSVFSWRQSQSQLYLQQRFNDITRHLDSSDESLAQSGAALAIKLSQQEETLAKHWSEIKKLWGVANDRNKKSIKALELVDASANKALKKTQQAQAALQARVKNMQAEMKKVSSASLVASAQTDDFYAQLQSLEKQLKAFDSEAASLQKLIEKNRQAQSRRLTEFEQAVKSMDAFRKQTNEKFSRLQPGSSAP